MQLFADVADIIRKIFGSTKSEEPVEKLEKKPDKHGDFLKELQKDMT